MKKIFLFILMACGFSNAQIIDIPDANLKSRLVNTNCASFENGAPANSFNAPVDTNADGEIQVSEALAVKGLRVNTSIMTHTNDLLSLEGIQYFTNLQYLNCLGNQIASLDVTMMPDLFELNCSYNSLASVDFSGLLHLDTVNCNHNSIVSMPLDNLPALRILQANMNLLPALDATALSMLQTLTCESNQIASLEIHDLAALQEVQAFNNQLSGIDLSGLSGLQYLGVGNNLLTGFDLSPLPNLETLDVSSNPITAIDLSGHANLYLLYIGNTLVSEIDCSASGIRYLKCAFNPNLTSINLKNGVSSLSDPDLLDYTLVIAEVPLLTSICIDDDANERNSVAYTDYNASGNVTVYTGENCLTEVNMATAAFDRTMFVVYPNPVKDRLTIEAAASIETVSVCNALGQKLTEVAGAENSATIDVSGFATGTYFLRITTASGQQMQKFIKQ